MNFVADLHIHSHFSRATSKLLTPEYLDFYAGLKGIKVVGTGDFTHPGWLAELKEKTVPEGNGFLKLKNGFHLNSPFGNNNTRFLLTAEISNIYKRGGKVRKVHNVVLVPGFEEAEKINTRLTNLGGNLTSDGRPILGLDSRDLLEIVLECGESNYFIPAHIWTPWFSMLGSKSGFDSLKECFNDLSSHIYTIETGLSTDAPMNWLCSFLDRVSLVSNSDAHSPDKLGRNANVFNTNPDYFSLTEALKTGDPQNFLGTIDMYPQEGKYHFDGHRNCNICWDPTETLRNDYVCPVCKKPVTVGVMNRIIQLSDREDISERPGKLPFRSLIPLKELLAEINGVGSGSKKVAAEYEQTLRKLGVELNILQETPLEEIESKSSKILAEAIRRMRNREVFIQEGYDGEYGAITVFSPGEVKNLTSSNALFQIEKPAPPGKKALLNFDLRGIQKLVHQKKQVKKLALEKGETYKAVPQKILTFDGLNPEQFEAVKYFAGPSLIIAGPGTGKTKTLTSKIGWLIQNHVAQPKEILAITFTNKAAGELKQRLVFLLKNKKKAGEVTIKTFHSFGLSVLNEFYSEFQRTKNFVLVDEDLKTEILKFIFYKNKSETKRLAKEISEIKKGVLPESSFYKKYEQELQKLNSFDLDDLISKPQQLFFGNKQILAHFQKKAGFIFVDEYQDTNFAQYRLLRFLAPDPNSNICVVGDANQSIYGFRGASASYISQFTKDFPTAKIFRLVRSYRCSQTILNASSNVIANSYFLEGLKEGVRISISKQPTGAAEAEFIARQIVDLVGGISFFSLDSSVAGGNGNDAINSLSDLAILCRTRNQFDTVSKALRDHNIPYQETGTTPFFQKEFFQSFTVLLNAFLLDRYETAVPFFNLKKKKITRDQFEQVKLEIKKSGLNRALEFIKQTFFVTENIDEQEWKRFLWIAGEMEDLSSLVTFLKLGAGTDAHDKNLEAVSLMTLHASKGLEFECVFIPGCENGLLPYNLYKKTVDIDEEKRLLYVGMTRAKTFLYLTYAQNRTIRGRKFRLLKSPFLDSIQDELVRQIENKPAKINEEKDNQLSLF